jgi:hypothetical protein
MRSKLVMRGEPGGEEAEDGGEEKGWSETGELNIVR